MYKLVYKFYVGIFLILLCVYLLKNGITAVKQAWPVGCVADRPTAEAPCPSKDTSLHSGTKQSPEGQEWECPHASSAGRTEFTLGH